MSWVTAGTSLTIAVTADHSADERGATAPSLTPLLVAPTVRSCAHRSPSPDRSTVFAVLDLGLDLHTRLGQPPENRLEIIDPRVDHELLAGVAEIVGVWQTR